MVEGPARALQLVDALAATGALDGYWPLHAARADLLRRLDRPAEAQAAYARTLPLVRIEAERRLLERRMRRGPT
jgi:RNA polymerase sigma-70 factor (ECF subfamily)